jgi:hypothetical protein
MMAAIDRDDDELPAPIAEALVDAGLVPQVETLLKIITDFAEARAKGSQKTEGLGDVVECFPLNAFLPSGVSYEVARRAAVRGTLRASLIGARWFATEANVRVWLAATGRGKCR